MAIGREKGSVLCEIAIKYRIRFAIVKEAARTNFGHNGVVSNF
jgi:hypothetical protein